MFTYNHTVFRVILFVFITVSVLLVTDSVLASNQREAGKHKSWYLGNGKLEVWVSIIQTDVSVRVWSDVPATVLQKVNSHLWNVYDEQYVVISDFNRDGQLDVGVMEGAGLAGNDKCYAVYEYNPQHFSYRNTSSMTVCR